MHDGRPSSRPDRWQNWLSRHWLSLPRPSGFEYCAAGVVLLGISLITRHDAAFQYLFLVGRFEINLIPFLSSWLGALAVIVGAGRLLFIEG